MIAALAGPRNDITDVAGVRVGQYQRKGRGWLTGTTVILPPEGTVGSVDVRGGGPATRETDALHPSSMVQTVDAVVLSGGSGFGLVTSSAVADALAQANRGFQVGAEPHQVVPIVAGASLFDLGASGTWSSRPDYSFGTRAFLAAKGRKVVQGTVGAGTGAHAGSLKGGVGSASVLRADGITVAALVALNPGGSLVDESSGELWGARYLLQDELPGLRPPSKADFRRALADELVGVHPKARGTNTLLAVVATDAKLTKAEAHRLAMAGHDGMARAVRPIHTMTDGDVVFSLATGQREIPSEQPGGGVIRPLAAGPRQLSQLMSDAADVVCRAIVQAAVAATSAGTMRSYLDVFPSAWQESTRQNG